MAPSCRLRCLAWHGRRPVAARGVAALGAAATVCCLWAATDTSKTAPCFTAGKPKGGRSSYSASGGNRPHFVRPYETVTRYAEAPKLEEEPDIPKELAKMLKQTVLPDDEPREFSVAQRITPIDRWFGWDKQMIANRMEDDPFVDASDERSYTTVWLEKPLGIEFEENPMGEGGGAMIRQVVPGYSAHASGLLVPGCHLIVADNKPVHGLPFDEALQPIVEKEGKIKLTFFNGDALYFYGEFRPDASWFSDFLERLKEQDREIAQSEQDDDDSQ